MGCACLQSGDRSLLKGGYRSLRRTLNDRLLSGGYRSLRRTLNDRQQSGGYRTTARNRKYLKMHKAGKSIGFTMTASLKAKGLIPRADGTLRVSGKYQTRRRK